MDNSNPVNPTQTQPTNPAPAPTPNQPIMPQPGPTVPPDVTLVSGNKGGGSKLLMVIGIVVLLLAVLGGGAYYYMTSLAPKSRVVTKAPINLQTSDLSAELQAAEPEDISGDFSAIDEDIQSL